MKKIEYSKSKIFKGILIGFSITLVFSFIISIIMGHNPITDFINGFQEGWNNSR